MGISEMNINVQSSNSWEVDNGAEAILVRKIDWRIIPTLFLAYFLQFLDKVAVNYANVMGLQKDLRMQGQDFAWTATAFFIGYVVAELPQGVDGSRAGVLLQRFSVSKVLGYNIFLWGIILCCSAACHSTASIIAVRTLLGMCEAVIAPALIVVTSRWYTRTEAPLRYGIWYCGLGAGQIFGGLISFGAQHSSSTFAGWRVMFICIGIVNILVALVVLLTLPGGSPLAAEHDPEQAIFLNYDEKRSIRERLEADKTLAESRDPSLHLLGDLLLDPQTWLLVLLTLCITIPSGVITTFSAVLIHSFGFDSKQSALLNMPSGVISIFATTLSTWAVVKQAPRWLSIVGLLIPALVGGALLSFEGIGRPAGSVAGIYLVNFADLKEIVAPLAIIYNWVGANYNGHTQRVTASAIVSAAFGIANIIGPQTYQAKDAPGYLPAKITLLIVIASAVPITLALRVLYGHRNRTRVSGGFEYCL
ncbi:major facilitator superfamily transporter [Aureobasidium sp. EXF-3400]|nr:major facilitator superfamily transporter [Aureobasidium sp. EXF-12344]KAI4782558.1 major facilitator superfamily transporter [Aureobasidium sp. EXF-3400]